MSHRLCRDVCAVVPCFNEERTIGPLVSEIRQHLDLCIVVDDCSADRTAELAAAAGARLLRHERNLGKGAALRNGFALAAASGVRAAITLDGDGQHDPQEIPHFLSAFFQDDADIVLGDRMGDPAPMPFVRRLTNRFSSWCISQVTGVPIRDSQTGFRLIRLGTWEALPLEGRRFDLESEVLIKACRRGARLAHVPVRAIYRGTEQSKINPLFDTLRFFRVLWRCRRA
jgi:glycosyltransferase involved in cell wall biosynthesis